MKLKKLGAELSTSLPGRTATTSKLGSGTRAFTVIELTGVLAIIAMLGAAVIPNVLRKIDRATWDRETSDLKVMANGLTQAILTCKQIPATNNVGAFIATNLDLSLNQVTTTPRGFTRRFMVDPNVNINNNGLAFGYGQGPDNLGSANRPANARVMILSTIAGSPVSSITETFSTIWNTLPGAKPSSWNGKADDLCIQRVELGSLFHKLVLLNIDPANDGYYTFESNDASSSYVAHAGPQLTAYVLHGTAISFYSGGDPSRLVLQVREILDQDKSFVYQNNRWSRTLSSDQLSLTLDEGSFGWYVNKFLESPAPPSPDFGATQRVVIDEFYTYLWSYWSWSQAGFAGQSDSPKVQNPFFVVVGNSQVDIATFTYNLTH